VGIAGYQKIVVTQHGPTRAAKTCPGCQIPGGMSDLPEPLAGAFAGRALGAVSALAAAGGADDDGALGLEAALSKLDGRPSGWSTGFNASSASALEAFPGNVSPGKGGAAGARMTDLSGETSPPTVADGANPRTIVKMTMPATVPAVR